jgi:hypothetical protein
MLEQHLGKPLTKVPDPFGTHASFGEHNNARLRTFLDHFAFDYEFMSSTECYRSGRFDQALLKVLARFDEVMAIMLPSLREERAATYSPFLPIDQKSGIVLQVPVVGHDAKAGTITYEDPESKKPVTTPVTGGRCKLQWKPDWAMRWVALGVDYEMAGKDLIDSVKLSGEICRALGGEPPEGFNYELFLDEEGPENLQVEGQRPHHRGMAALRQPREPVIVHVPRTEGGEAALLRRHPAHGRRVLPVSRRLRAAGRPPAAVKPGVAHSLRRAAEGRHADLVFHAADAGVVVECRECRDAVGLHRPLPAGRHAENPSQARRVGHIRDSLFP